MKGADLRVKELLNKSKEFLEAAELLYKHKFYDSAVSRSYYAMFTAARALLLTKDIKTKGHRGTLIKFREAFVKTGEFPRELGDALAKSESLREIGDYSPVPDKIPENKVRDMIEKARVFVSEAEKYLEREGYIGKEQPPTTEEKMYAVLQSGTQYEIDGDYVKLIRVDKPVRCDICGKTVEQGEMLAVKERLGGGRYRTKYYCGDEYALEKRAVEKGTGRIVEREKIKDLPQKEREKSRSLAL